VNGARTAPFREAIIDLGAISRNVAHLRATIGTRHTMAVVKANGYGHGGIESARAALAGGADWLGVADIEEALALRAAGIDAPVLAWLHAAHTDFAPAIAAGVDIGVSSVQQLDAVADAAARVAATGTAAARHAPQASVQLKLETGLSRNGASEPEWPALFGHARELEETGALAVRGIFSHLANTSLREDGLAADRFERGVAAARAAGLTPALLHLAASAAALELPRTRYSMVRLGISIYGLSPFEDRSSADLGLTPAMTLRGGIAAVRTVPAGSGVSYGYTYRTREETTLVLVPLGYADGVPRAASNAGPVTIDGRAAIVSGRIAMDQFVVDVGDASVAVGDEAVLFGNPAVGAPSADDWARAAGTINYEVVTRIGPRVPRVYVRS